MYEFGVWNTNIKFVTPNTDEKAVIEETLKGIKHFAQSPTARSDKDENSFIPRVIVFVLHHAEHRYS